MTRVSDVENIVRQEDFGVLVYNIKANSITRLNGQAGVERLNNPGTNTLIRGEHNESVGEVGLRAPEKVYIDITKACNMFCTHCLSESGVHSTDTLSLETMVSLADQMVMMGIFRTKLGGGEPPIHPDFKEMVRELRARDIGISMSTNGLLVANRDDLAPFLAEQGVRVSVSLDGGEETHVKIRQHPDAFRAATVAAKRLKEAGVYVAFGTTLSKDNLADVPKVIEIAEELQVPVKFKRVKPLGRALTNNLLINPKTPGYKVAIETINSSKWSRPEGMLNTGPCDPADDIFPEFNSCGSGTRSMGINPAGQYSPCFFLGADFLESNAKDQTLKGIWINGRTFGEMRKVAKKGVAECNACEVRSRCHGECRAVSLHMTGNINAVDPGCPKKNP